MQSRPNEDVLIAADRNDPDALALVELVEAGADLGRTHRVEFAFATPRVASAEAIANVLLARGWDVDLVPADDDEPDHAIVVRRRMRLDLAELQRLTSDFTAIATRHGATYAGWDVPDLR